MSLSVAGFAIRARPRAFRPLYTICIQSRHQSTSRGQTAAFDAGVTEGVGHGTGIDSSLTAQPSIDSPLSRLSTTSIMRSLFLGTFFSSPLLFRSGFAVFKKIANSKSTLLDPDRNPFLRVLIRPLVYDQFCAGRNKAEINKTANEIRRLGFSGVVLCYSKEVLIGPDDGRFIGYEDKAPVPMEVEIEHWKDGNFKTLDMIGQGDWLGMKYTGAGINVTKALIAGEPAPAAFTDAMEAVCEKAASQGCRIWVDAEQQIVQGTIDKWTYEYMRRFNRLGKQALVYNTVQAYLKCSRDKVQHQLDLARREGWRSAIKLVRGAYISNDIRSGIHDTKEETDNSYNSIVRDLLQGNFPAIANGPKMEFDILLAGHNSQTIRTAVRMATELATESKLQGRPEFAQLQGMADDIGCEILQIAEAAQKEPATPQGDHFVPRVYKCLTWGSLQGCMQYLARRLIENEGASNRMLAGQTEFRGELWRRLKTSLRVQS